MHYELQDFLVKGRKNDKTKEKLRINIRFLLNKHKAASLFISNFSNSKMTFQLEKDGFKAAFFVYKSTAISNCMIYNEAFNDLYINELLPIADNLYCNANEEKSTFKIVLAFRKTKKSF